MLKRLLAGFALLLPLAPLGGQTLDATDTVGAGAVMDRVVRDLCDKRVALLTEPSTHGFGNTLAFKAALVRRLVDECHYDAFMIESGVYDFLNIARRLDAQELVPDSMLTAAIGGVWANREVSALVPFLLDRARRVRRGRLTLAGLDDQFGAGTWAQREMAEELVRDVSAPDRERCLAVLRTHLLWQYTDSAPFGGAEKARIVGCLDAVSHVSPRDPARAVFDTWMVENFRRALAQELPESRPAGVDENTFTFDARDRAMLLNFQWWLSRLPARSKVIVWTATVHGAKDLAAVPGYAWLVPMGPSIQREFGSAAFVLAFSAARGAYRFARQPEHALPIAPDSTMEGGVFRDGGADVRYVDAAQLRRLGVIAARPLGADFKAADWSRVVDGVVVFREERAPRR